MSQKSVCSVAILAVLLLAAAHPVRADDESAHDLVKRAIESAPDVPVFSRVKLTSSRGWTREFEASHKKLENSYASYMEFTSPQDMRDTRFLAYDYVEGRDQQFMWVPTVRRAIEIVNEARKQPFVGSDFYVSDMVAAPIEDYTYKFVGEADVGGRHCKLVESVPKDLTDSLYSKTVTAIDPVDLVTMRTEFYDPKGELLKVWTVEKLEKIDGFWTPMVQVMKNVQQNTDSKIETVEIKYNADLPELTFTRAYLLR